MLKAVVVAIFLTTCVGIGWAFVLNNSECPPPESIMPCRCNYNDLICDGILNSHDLVKVFANSAGRTFDDVLIRSSAIQYIPHQMFEYTKVKKLYIEKSTLVELFDSPPETPNLLDTLRIEESKILRHNWSHLTPLNNLEDIYISNTEIKVLDETFGRSLPESVENLVLRGTNTKTIKPGAFQNLKNVKFLAINEAGLSSLRRNMFPTPFNVESLTFRENDLTSIPEDLFDQMPKLKVVDLRINQLQEIPEKAFGGRATQLDLLLLDVNPLKCDCGLAWLVSNGPKIRSGICESPAEMKEKRLSELTTEDFEC